MDNQLAASDVKVAPDALSGLELTEDELEGVRGGFFEELMCAE